MKSFNFNKSWLPKINLETLTKLGNEKIFNPKSHLEWIRTLYDDHKNQKIQLRIEAARNENDIPEEYQINAIEYILNNEKEIYQQIYENLKNKIYPYYSELLEEELEKDFPIDNLEMMPDVLGLIEIQVTLMHRNNMAWCTYIFEWQGEQEHGLSMLFEGSKFLKHDSAGDMWFSGIVPDDELEILRKEWNKEMPKQLYYPNSNLRSYKPWQLELSINYLLELLKNDEVEQFKNIVSSNDFDVNQKFPEDGVPILEQVVRKGYFEMGKLLHQLGANPKGIMHFGNPYYENTFRIEFINMIKGDLDEKNEGGMTLLEKYLEISSRELRFKNLRKIDMYEQHVKLLIQYGAKISEKEQYRNVLIHMNIIDE